MILITVLDTQVRERFAEFCRAEGISLGGAVRAYLERFIGQLRDDGLLVAGHVVELRENSPSGTIRELAQSLNASMLVIGPTAAPESNASFSAAPRTR